MGSVLVVEDNELVVRSLQRFFRHANKRVIVSRTVASAREVLKSDELIIGIVLDLQLPDGSGLEIFDQTAGLNARIPTMVLSGTWSEDLVRRAQAYGSLFVPKPATLENLRAFLEWADGTWAARTTLRRELSRLSRRHGLTPRETEIVSCAARGMSRTGIMTHLGITESTLKTLTRRMLKKAQVSGLDEIRSELLAHVFADEEGLRGVTDPDAVSV